MENLVCSAPNKESLEKLINKYYYSENWIINNDLQAENLKNGKKIGIVKITNKGKRYKLYN